MFFCFSFFCALYPLRFFFFLSFLVFGYGENDGTPTLVLLPGKSHGQRSLVGCSPWGPEESGTTERLYFHFLLSCIGERNGNPLQCSCLENPRDGGAWWTAIYGVAHSWTLLKRLSSSSSNVWLFFSLLFLLLLLILLFPFLLSIAFPLCCALRKFPFLFGGF